MKKFLLLLVLVPFVIHSQSKHALTVDDLWAMKRVGTYSLSPDGKTIAFSVTQYNMEANKGNTDIYLVNSDGSSLRPLKNSEKNESGPVFSPDGKKIAFIRDGKIWTCGYDGSGEELIADISTGGFRYSMVSRWFKNIVCLFSLS